MICLPIAGAALTHYVQSGRLPVFPPMVALFRPSDVAAPVPIQETKNTWLAARGSHYQGPIRGCYGFGFCWTGCLRRGLEDALYVIQLAWPG